MTRALQIRIHTGCRALGLDEDARRALQMAETGKASMTEMTAADLKKVLKRLENDGFKPSSKRVRKYPEAPRGDLKFVHVLWTALGNAGKLKDPTRAGLNAFVRKTFGKHWKSVPTDIDHMRDAAQIRDVVEALKSWIRREKVPFDWERTRR